jgi:hypothetical protein
VASDTPTCGTTGAVCGGGFCPIGQRCDRTAQGCACTGESGPDDGYVPSNLPPGTYAVSWAIPGANIGPIEAGQFPLSDPIGFRDTLTGVFEGVAMQFETPDCATAVIGTPFNGTFFTVTFRITCQNDEGTIQVTELIFEVRKVG